MIIVSQDKKELINFNNMENIEIDNPFENNDGKFTIEATSIDTNSYFLGEYDTEERTKEILKEIVDCFGNYLKLKAATFPMTEDLAIFNIPKIYEMPEK